MTISHSSGQGSTYKVLLDPNSDGNLYGYLYNVTTGILLSETKFAIPETDKHSVEEIAISSRAVAIAFEKFMKGKFAYIPSDTEPPLEWNSPNGEWIAKTDKGIELWRY